MGEVYRARDPKLQRDVAIKALPEEFQQDPATAPRASSARRGCSPRSTTRNIAAIHGLEEQGGTRFLVMELVEGQTLDERLAEGPLPLDEALAVAAQIAAGLEAAHEAGIIHRDLKPSNVKLRPGGSVKVLDLGLARTVDTPGALDSSFSPTRTTPATLAGVILGTAAYMSPEQARGKPLDKRTDIFSFGSVVYECLTGEAGLLGGNGHRHPLRDPLAGPGLVGAARRDPREDSRPAAPVPAEGPQATAPRHRRRAPRDRRGADAWSLGRGGGRRRLRRPPPAEG